MTVAPAEKRDAKRPPRIALTPFLRRHTDLPASEADWLERQGRRRTLVRGEAFCTVGQIVHEWGFLEEGILQVYGVQSDGAHATLDFMFPGHFAIAFEAALRGTASNVCFEAVTPCTLVAWPYAIHATALAHHPSWVRLTLRMTEDAFLRKHQRFMSLRVQTAEERYASLAQDLPPGWEQIPQHMLASFLDITPQYLSRLKRDAASGSKERRHGS